MNERLVTRIPLFAGVRRRERRTIAALADEVVIPAGTRLTREGALASEFYVVLEGTATVRIGADEVRELGPGDFFGELGLLEGHRRTATVVASSPMRVLVSGAREFAALVDAFPAVGARIRAAAAARSAAAAAA